MEKSLQFGLALALLATPTLAEKFSGQYTLTLYGPHHQSDGSVCYAFTPKGQTVNGFPNSGKWVQVGNEQIGGDFIVNGHDLHFFGAVPSGSDILAFSFHVSMNSGKGDFDWWLANRSPIEPTANGTLTFASGC